jgi:methylase of polypeptide subunit release factors
MASTSTAPHPLHLLLPQLGTEEDFVTLRETLRACGFHNEGICQRLGIPSIVDFVPKCEGRKTAIEMEYPVDAIIRLVLDGEFVAEQVLESKLPAGAVPALERLGILVRSQSRPGHPLFSAVTMYPAEETLVLAGDRPGTPDGSPYRVPDDVVYPGAIENTRHFLAGLPQTPCDALLDIGTGSGVAALSAASRYARHAWGVDIAARSARFAEFNRRMNGIGNATILEGNLYEPVRHLTFDRIVTHPPYVPAPKIKMIYSDGGEDGEQILAGIIQGLPRHLRTGGRFCTLVLGADCEGEAFEDRIRKWLGPQQGEFDIVMVSHSLRSPMEFAARALAKGKVGLTELKFWTETWNRRQVEFLFYGSILIRRHAGGRAAVTARVLSALGYGPDHQGWLLDWETDCEDPAFRARLMDWHPELPADASLKVLHRLQEGRFAPVAFAVESGTPFNSEVRCQNWMVALLSECSGEKTWREHLERARRLGTIGPEATEDEFAGILRTLAGQGILRVRERPLPPDARPVR